MRSEGQAALPRTDPIADFLYLEADLLDAQRWEEWLALYAPDAWYWVPARADQPDPLNELSLIYDDYALLQARVARLRHPSHFANTPAVRTTHHVSNVRSAVAEGRREEIAVSSRLLMVEYRGPAQRLFGARVEHGLRTTPDGLKIASKKIVLAAPEAPQEEIVVPF
ncbi:MAG: aromatic-ring-hydroxylating dioxygenase subunit beta [Rhodospirillaceae bacterium]|nr:aromatic-ring-hydroxylating dioxygenase subunit beta [Rhodospirillaceae bacterium]